MAEPTPLSSLKVTRRQIPAYEGLPNTSIQNKPLMLYHSTFSKDVSASTIEAHLRTINEVVPQWRYTMYPQTHFHSTTHEVLCVCSGSAKLCFGGEGNSDRFEPVVFPGDVMIVPAGVAHRLLEDHGGFQMIGSYPKGKEWDMCYGREEDKSRIGGISQLAWFQLDPIYGEQGPVHDAA